MIVDESTNFRHAVSYNSQTDEDGSSDEHLANNDYFLSASEDTGRIDPSPDFSVIGQHSKKGIKLLAGRK